MLPGNDFERAVGPLMAKDITVVRSQCKARACRVASQGEGQQRIRR